jgi:CRP-like cAMP-binding protein
MRKKTTAHSRVKKHDLTDKMKSLAASALAREVGYLRFEELPETRFFDTLPTRSLGANRIIRGKDELLLVRRGLVEIWHTRHDLLVKKLTAGALFGDMPLLGQTMLGTKAITGPEGASVAVMDIHKAKEWIKAAPVSILEKIGNRLACINIEYYRSRFQLSDSRIAAVLIEKAGEGSHILGLTHEAIGEQIGVYRETVTITLDAMRLEKLIDVGRKKITILDKSALRELSEL